MTKGRKQLVAAEAVDGGVNEAALTQASEAANVMALRLAEIAQQYGDGQEYDRTRVVHEAKMFMSASAEAMLEAGKRLIVLREREPHGEFTQIIEQQLGLNKRTAQVMMQAAARYLAPALQSKAQAPALLAIGKTKLLELLAEPDEAIAALADGGTVAGLTIDKIDAMSTRELRAALRKAEDKAKKDTDAKDRVIKAKEERLTALEEQLARLASADPDERQVAQVTALRDAGLVADEAIRVLVAQVSAVMASPANGTAELAARQAIDYAAQVFAELLEQAGITVDFAERVTALWAPGAVAAKG